MVAFNVLNVAYQSVLAGSVAAGACMCDTCQCEAACDDCECSCACSCDCGNSASQSADMRDNNFVAQSTNNTAGEGTSNKDTVFEGVFMAAG
jgi:hypothetical protein